ncbi:gustatory receptor for sugar taste 64f isoform X2 [Halyomorpha halys]|uniref:gustatory receptor for sugar taste 64f isoform X2 n=1 Tax=Halyomorpha halys TaxID=286706 RepID=UPI0006D4FC91
MINNNIMRDRIDVDLLGNITTQSILHYLSEEERKDNKKKKEKADSRSTIQLELRTPLLLAQFLSLLPIYGVSNPDYRKLRFEWKSWKVLYSFGIITFNIILCIFALNRYIRDRGVTYRSLGDIMFFGSTLLISMSFLILVRQWKDFIGKWASLQGEMNNFESSNVQKKIKLLTNCLLFSSIFEHILSNTQFMLNVEENQDRLRMFLDDKNVSSVLGFNTWCYIFIYFGNFLITLIWNYTDIFLTAVSLSLANMFKQFNRDLRMTAAMVSHDNALSYWRRKRELYNSLSLLAKTVEEKISRLVLISFSVNLYFICIQLLNSIQPLTSFLQVAYFCGSFGHILFRTCSVCFAATSIYEHSKGSLPTLYSVSSEQFNSEVQRLIDQVTGETLALTGCKFFTVTRTLMLTIAGTIVTYEVVLVQFNNPTDDSGSDAHNSSRRA